MVRAGIYARISSDREGDGLGVRRQVEDQRKWEVVERYVDDDVSAYSGRARPAYRRMLDDVHDGFLDAVVVWHVDRLVRQPKEFEEFFEIVAAASVSDLASVSSDIDLSKHDGQFTARSLGAVAKKESDDKSRRITRKHEELAQAGKLGGDGTRPFGFESDSGRRARPVNPAPRGRATRLTGLRATGPGARIGAAERPGRTVPRARTDY